MNVSKLWKRGRFTAVTTSLALGAALALAGCAGSEAGGGGEAGSLSESDQRMLEDLYDGTSVSPATKAPTPQPGKRIWIVSAGQSVDVAAQAVAGAADAAKAIGWKPKIFDAQLQMNIALQGIQQAIATKADGIILYGIDCATVKAGLEQAKRAKIPVVGMESRACEGRLLTELSYEPGSGLDGLSRAYGSAGALWLVSQSPTDATFLELTQNDSQSVVQSSEGYRSTLKSACPDCTNVPVEFTAADFGPGLQQKVQQALAQNPDAVGLWAPYDGLITGGVSAAVMASGRADTIKVISGGGSEPNLDLIRQRRGQNADIAFSNRWEGFATIDWMNRILNGETPTDENAPTGIGIQLVDVDHNLPESGPVPSEIDFEDVYLKAWGVRE